MATDAPTYRIETVADFAQVPPERLRACLAEFVVCIEVARATQQALQTIQDAIAPGTEPVAWPLQAYTWIDDGERHVTARLTGVDEQGNVVSDRTITLPDHAAEGGP